MKLMSYLKPPPQWIIFVTVLVGAFVGLLLYSVYISNAYSYLSDDPKTCVNCHVMMPEYATWQHSSHSRVATCNDCHVPHTNPVAKYAFKAMDGLGHATAFTLRKESQVIRIKERGSVVVQENCKRCHSELVLNVGLLNITPEKARHGEGKLCWECHREVPHGRVKGLSSTPNARVPLLGSPVPDWLRKQTNK
ncbi:MAG: cytochrome c nitrite reductase small subunit [Bacteroidetes bacterium]|nr:cytochrome c nitrite reductase small subunit [Bacteroidota bacterium]